VRDGATRQHRARFHPTPARQPAGIGRRDPAVWRARRHARFAPSPDQRPVSEEEVMSQLSHFDDQGASRMVDTSQKPETLREARAGAQVRMQPARLKLTRDKGLSKGDVLEVPRLAGIQAAKRTGELIPLCHPLPITAAAVDFAFEGDAVLHIEATV